MNIQKWVNDVLTERPINIEAFFTRDDVPVDVKDRVREAGGGPAYPTDAEAAGRYRLMQAQILIEALK